MDLVSAKGSMITYPPHASLVLQGNLTPTLPSALVDTHDPGRAAVGAAVEALPTAWQHSGSAVSRRSSASSRADPPDDDT